MKKMIKGGDNISPSCNLYYNMVPPDAVLPRQHKERCTDQCCLEEIDTSKSF